MNSLLQVIWSQRRLHVKPEVRLFRTQFKQFLPVWTIPLDRLLLIRFDFYQDWYCKNGRLKKQDVPNLIKSCLDAFVERYGIDDSCVLHQACSKVQSSMTGILLTASLFPELDIPGVPIA